MAIKINFDTANNPENPTIVLAKRNGDKLGKINAHSIEINDSLNDASEITFNVNKYINGEKDYLWDKIVDFKLVYCVEWNMWFEIRVEIDESNEVVKTVFCTQLGCAELSQISLYNIQINTEEDIEREEYEIPTVLYYPEHPEASLLHRIMEKAPHYYIAHVDESIKNIQRTFEFDDTSIYDAFQEIADEINCIFILDSCSDENGHILRTVSVYDLESTCKDCGHRDDFVGVCPECGSSNVDDGYGEDTGIFVTADEIASELQLSTDTEQIKNCFKLEAGDDMMNATIRNCNPNGSDYIWYISDAMKEDMSVELVNAINSYDEKYDYYYKTKDYATMLDAESVLKYNNIITEYGEYLNTYINNDDDEYDNNAYKDYMIPSSIVGYQPVMKIYYDVIDMSIFLKSAMMPTAKLSDTTAEYEASKLTTENISPVAAADEKTLNNMSVYTADNIILSVAKIVADSRYKVSVSSSEFDKDTKIWTGYFTVTNYSDENDTANSEKVTVQVNANYEDFVKQKIDKALDKGDDEDVSISGLFKKEITKDEEGVISGDFVDELKKYSLNRLLSFHDACQSCIDILVEQGIADNETWSTNTEGKNLYDDLYQPYRNRLQAIENEMNKRQSDVELIVGAYDEEGNLIEKGLQNYIEDVINAVQDDLDFQDNIGDNLWLEFCSFRRDDKYSNDNYVSDGLNNAELINNANEFIKAAKKEIYKSAELQTSISSNLHNLLTIEKFKPLVENFKVGNWIRVMIDDRVYKLRLIEYGVDYESIEGISVEFADAVKNNSTINDVKEVLDQASSMATSYNSVKRQAKQGEQSKSVLNNWVENGLDATNTKIIGGADNQTQVMDSHGMLFRKFDVATNDYEPTQMKIINSTMAITDDNWETTKTAIGQYYYIDSRTGELNTAYGINAETVIGKFILGENMSISNESGNMVFDGNGLIITSGSDDDVGTMTFDENGLVVRHGNNTVVISPKYEEVMNITNGEEKVFEVNENGELSISGNIMARSLRLDSGVTIDSGVVTNLATVAVTGDYDDLINKPSFATVATSGKYTDLTGTPSLAAVATSGKYTDLTDRPSFSTVATSGQYTDLSGSTANAGKLLYVDTDGSVTTISISELKTLLGI